jgi:hypothetical protein
MERLSSSLTFFYKFVFTGLWGWMSGIGLVAVFVSDKPATLAARWPFVAAFLVGSVFLWWACARLKRVDLDGETLVVSNYRDDIRVPVDEIARVTQNILVNVRPITVTFKKETLFGSSIVFIPPVSFRVFSEDEVLIRLRRLAGKGADGSS